MAQYSGSLGSAAQHFQASARTARLRPRWRLFRRALNAHGWRRELVSGASVLFDMLLGTEKPLQISSEDQRLFSLLAAFREADFDHDEVARAVFGLWQAFNGQFDGLTGFLGAERSVQDRYLDRLSAFTSTLGSERASAQASLFHAVTLFEAYVGCWRDQPRGKGPQSLSTAVVALIERGRTRRDTPPPKALSSAA